MTEAVEYLEEYNTLARQVRAEYYPNTSCPECGSKDWSTYFYDNYPAHIRLQGSWLMDYDFEDGRSLAHPVYCRDCKHEWGIRGLKEGRIPYYSDFVADKEDAIRYEQHQEALVVIAERQPEPKPIPYDKYDYIVVAYRLDGKTLQEIADLLASEYGHNVSYQAIQSRISKIIRFGKNFG